MKVHVSPSKSELGLNAGDLAAKFLFEALDLHEAANIIAAAAPSQDATLNRLFSQPSIPWERVNFFHMDEYVGIPRSHTASFRRYFDDRIPDDVLKRLRSATWIDGDAKDQKAELSRLNQVLNGRRIDLLLCGIGENTHLAFNDPPCKVKPKTPPVLIVRLDRACREQQLAEGHFPSLDRVPTKAYTLSVPFLMTAKRVVCSVPGDRKATAIWRVLRCAKSTPWIPASYLKRHENSHLFVDTASGKAAGCKSGEEFNV